MDFLSQCWKQSIPGSPCGIVSIVGGGDDVNLPAGVLDEDDATSCDDPDGTDNAVGVVIKQPTRDSLIPLVAAPCRLGTSNKFGCILR